MDSRDQMDRAVAARKVDQAEAAARLGDDVRERLRRIIEKKLKTTLIGSLSRFEEHVGRTLWGHGLPDDQKTDAQRKWAEVWARCRSEALDNGNNQRRALEKELQLYAVRWLGYRTTMPVVPPPEEDS